MNRDALKAMLRADEGLRLKAYRDTLGVLTIGYGHTGSDVYEGQVISVADAEQFLDEDCASAVSQCRQTFGWFNDLCDMRQNVLANMVFNEGLHGVLEFKKMIAAIECGDFASAANEMLCSRWAGQVGKRATELAQMMREGDTIH